MQLGAGCTTKFSSCWCLVLTRRRQQHIDERFLLVPAGSFDEFAKKRASCFKFEYPEFECLQNLFVNAIGLIGSVAKVQIRAAFVHVEIRGAVQSALLTF